MKMVILSNKDVKLSDKDIHVAEAYKRLRGTVIAALIAAGKDYSINRGGDYEGIHGVAYDATLFSVAQNLSIGTRDIDTRDDTGQYNRPRKSRKKICDREGKSPQHKL